MSEKVAVTSCIETLQKEKYKLVLIFLEKTLFREVCKGFKGPFLAKHEKLIYMVQVSCTIQDSLLVIYIYVLRITPFLQ